MFNSVKHFSYTVKFTGIWVWKCLMARQTENKPCMMYVCVLYVFISVGWSETSASLPVKKKKKKKVEGEVGGTLANETQCLQRWTPVRGIAVRMRYSVKCHDLTTRWESSNSTCVPCSLQEGMYWWSFIFTWCYVKVCYVRGGSHTRARSHT